MVGVATDKREENIAAYYSGSLIVVKIGNDFLSKRQFLVLEIDFFHNDKIL